MSNWRDVVIKAVIIGGVVFISVLSARIIPVGSKLCKIDTIYIERNDVTNSLLLDITQQLHKINENLSIKNNNLKKVKRPVLDTIHIDAHLHLNDIKKIEQ